MTFQSFSYPYNKVWPLTALLKELVAYLKIKTVSYKGRYIGTYHTNIYVKKEKSSPLEAISQMEESPVEYTTLNFL